MVDERDFMIISQLRRDPFVSYETMGRGVGLSGNAVRDRIEALERAKILTSLKAVPAAQVFRRRPRLFFFKQPASLERLESAIATDSAVFATLDVNRSAAVLIYDESHAPSHPADLVSLLGPIEMENTPLFPYPYKELAKPISMAELKVMRILAEDLRTSVKEISDSTGLSQRIVKRARRELLDRGLIQVQPIFQSARSSKILMYELHVHSSDDSVLLRLKQTLPRSMFINQWESGALILSCWADSIEDVFETERRLKNEPGVSGVRVKFHARAILSTSKLESWIDQEIQRLQTANRAS